MTRARNFVFTLNNYTAADEARIKLIACRYICYGREVGQQGTPHLQGYVSFTNARTHASARRLLSGCHVEIARGTPTQCRTYCSKDGDFYEDGDMPTDPGLREGERWKHALEAAKEGNFEEIPPDIILRHYSTIKRIRTDFETTPRLLDGPCGVWIHGVAGSGKTYAVFSQFPEIYPKGLNKWWCSYKGGPALLDDVDPTHKSWLTYFIKIWADRYPFVGESKGGSRKIRPSKFIVTSQYSIEDYCQGDQEAIAALNRRFIRINKVANQNIIL